MAELPFVLAGPIVRRVTARSMSIWVCLSQSAKVTLNIWDKVMASGPGVSLFTTLEAPLHSSASTSTLRIGNRLHVAMVTISLEPPPNPAPTPLLPGTLYSYNLVFDLASVNSDLKSLGLLQDKPITTEDPVPHLALGYMPGMLPSFVLPPVTIDKLNLVHGSCRKAHGPGKDSMAVLDIIIKKAVIENNPEKRPHQLYLTGDQIYADEVPTILLPAINALGKELLGVKENLLVKKAGGATEKIEASLANFPVTRRQRICNKNAMFTSGAAENHLLSFGEFAATYLMYWNNAVWPSDLFEGADKLKDKEDFLDTWNADPLTPLEQQLCPFDADEQKKFTGETAEKKAKRIQQTKDKVKDSYKEELQEVINFRDQLPHVRRAMANVPVFMIMDDHEVTDDWFITKDWRDRVLSAPLGVNVLRNGMMAYAIFQDWGNTPSVYNNGVGVTSKAFLLTQMQQIFPSSGEGPVTAAADQIDTLFGFDLNDETAPPVKWHYSVPCSETTIYVLDTRTRRTYETRHSPPGLLSDSAMDDQIPIAAQPEHFLIFVSPAPVLGLGAFEELLQPAMTVFNDFEADPEAWAFSPPIFENFLSRMEKFKRVVFLSGDVHFGSVAVMDYWKKNEPKAARFIQCISSGLKNQKFGSEQFLISGLVQELLGSLFYPGIRLGWKSKLGLQITNPAGKPIQPKHRIRLRKEPVLLPGHGWPAGTIHNQEPDWRWKLMISKDFRRDDNSADARPEKVQVKSISPDIDPVNNAQDGYDKVLARHMDIFKKSVGRTVVWDSNIGFVRFKTDGTGVVTVTQEMRYWLTADETTDDPDAFTSYKEALEPIFGPPPELTD
jgi:hypothetical protein